MNRLRAVVKNVYGFDCKFREKYGDGKVDVKAKSTRIKTV